MYSLNVSSNNPAAAFYSPLSRSWELMAGSLLALIGRSQPGRTLFLRSWVANTLSIFGMAMLFVPLFLMNKMSTFPGLWALLPVAGTAMLILAGSGAFLNKWLLANPAAVWIGLISYPLYLVHWPILSFLRVMEGQEISQTNRALAVLASFVLAWTIYRLIETPLRKGQKAALKVSVLISGMVVSGGIGLAIALTEGQWPRLVEPPKIVNKGDIGQLEFFRFMEKNYFSCTPGSILEGAGEWSNFKRCYQSKDFGPPQVALIGDSHAEHLFIGLASSLDQANVVYYAKGGLPLYRNPDFVQVLAHVIDDKHIKAVVLSAMWGREFRGFERGEIYAEMETLLTALTTAGKLVFVLDDVPVFPFAPDICKYEGRIGKPHNCRMQDADGAPTKDSYAAILQDLAEQIQSVKYLEIKPVFCSDHHCDMSADGMLLFRDKHHLNLNGSQFLWRSSRLQSEVLGPIEMHLRDQQSLR